MTEELGRSSLDNEKSENARLALIGIRQNSEVAFFATSLDWLMTEELGRSSLDNKKSENARLALTGKRGTKFQLVPLFATKLAQSCRSNKAFDRTAK